MNMIKTAMLIAFMTALFMAVGFLIGGSTGLILAFVLAAGMNLFSYWNADKLVLKMHHARQVNEREAPDFYRIVEGLAGNAGLPMPKVYLIENAQPNAFATGRNPQNAAVAATTGLLSSLSREEVAAVMAHELAHVEHRDTLIMTITATLAGAISMLGNFAFFFGGNRSNNGAGLIGVLAAMIVAPLAAMMVQMAISRTREYAADRRGAEICGNPLWLSSALTRIAQAAGRTVNRDAERNPATAHMFIINPLNGQKMDGLFSTHPATENRIAALKDLARQAGIDGTGNLSRTPVDAVAGPVSSRQPEDARRTSSAHNPGQALGPWGPRPKRPGRPERSDDRGSGRKGPWG